MALRDDIVEFCNDLLELHKYPDYGPMGLQFQGAEFVDKIAVAVSVNKQVIQKAGEQGAEMLIVHHGMFWNNESRMFDDRIGGRLDLLKKYNMNLLAYHLALDTHEHVGNNRLAAESLGLENLRRFGEIGWGGEYTQPIPSDHFVEKIGRLYSMPYRWHHSYMNHGLVQRVAVLVGAASQYIVQAHREGYDTFVTGEVSEPAYHLAQDLRINWIAAGHDNTEQSGVQRLGQLIHKKFHTQTSYIPTGNNRI